MFVVGINRKIHGCKEDVLGEVPTFMRIFRTSPKIDPLRPNE